MSVGIFFQKITTACPANFFDKTPTEPIKTLDFKLQIFCVLFQFRKKTQQYDCQMSSTVLAMHNCIQPALW